MKPFFLLSIVLICLNTNKALSQVNDVVSKRIASVTSQTDPQKAELAMNELVRQYQLEKPDSSEAYDVLCGTAALSFLQHRNTALFEKFIGKIRNKFNQTSYMNLAFERIFHDSSQRSYALVLARNTVLLYESYRNDSAARPRAFPIKDWNRFMQMAAYPYYHAYAQALYSSGNLEEALHYEEKALKDQQLHDLGVEAAQFYGELLAANGKNEKASGILRSFLEKGKGSQGIRELYKQIQIKNGASEQQVKSELQDFDKHSQKKYLADLTLKKMSNVVAPEFKLQRMDGKPVALSDFRGRIVVIDFWATWCQPCLASLPAMNTLQKKHPDVVFLFIATQEKGHDAMKRVKDFVQKNKYDFVVLMDRPTPTNLEEFEVASAYHIQAIPAKVVIDRHGRELFRSSGFVSEHDLINEIDAMITIAKQQ